MIGIIAERGAQALDGGVQAVLEIDERPLRPQTVPEIVPRDDVARVFEHEAKNLERLLLQADAALALAQLARPAVELE